jgi:hypothetical protein
MHRSLELEEILLYIFEFLNGDPEGPDLRSLANLAVTCCTFWRPAVEILWFHLPSLGPLVMCLPGDAWEVRPRTDVLFGIPALVRFFLVMGAFD